MKPLLFPALLAGLLAAMPALAAERTLRIQVGEMTCPTCAFTVAAAMRAVPSVQVVEVLEGDAFGEGVFVVRYDDTAAAPAQIVEAVTANGYPAQLRPEEAAGGES